MNKNQKPFERILSDIERKYSNFDGSGYYDYAEGTEDQQSEQFFQADPYQIVVHNSGLTAARVILFGHDKYLLQPNFGNREEVTLTMGQPGVDYVEFLQQSAGRPFRMQFLRIESENKLQVTKSIGVEQRDANGVYSGRPLNMQQYKSAFQNQMTMVDAPIELSINGGTIWHIDVEPETRVFYTIFPLYAVDTSGTLDGRQPIKTFAPPQINTTGLQIAPQSKLLKRG